MALRYTGNNYNKKIYNLVKNGSRVLDIGCNTGDLGEKLIREKGCYVYGVDFSSEALDSAKNKLNNIKKIDLENYKNPNIDKLFDTIIFADVLEHIRFPKKTLDIFKKLLTPNGVIIVSIPNVANISNRINLLFGKWDYTKIGILDETHLRFFTKKTALKLLKVSGFKIKKISYTNGCKFFILRYFKIFKSIRAILSRINPNLFSLQFIIVASLE